MKSSITLLSIGVCMLAVSSLSTLLTTAVGGELAGVTLPDTLKAGDRTLKLNGLGLRKKSIVKVYVGGLYLESPSKDAGAVLTVGRSSRQ